jgi:hypothetical protein
MAVGDYGRGQGSLVAVPQRRELQDFLHVQDLGTGLEPLLLGCPEPSPAGRLLKVLLGPSARSPATAS